MKSGDIVNVFADADKCLAPKGQARLVRREGGYGKLELWRVEYLDYLGYEFLVTIKNPNYGKNKTTRTYHTHE